MEVRDTVAVAIRVHVDGNTEVEKTEDYEGDQAYGYRGEADVVIEAIRKGAAERLRAIKSAEWVGYTGTPTEQQIIEAILGPDQHLLDINSHEGNAHK